MFSKSVLQYRETIQYSTNTLEYRYTILLKFLLKSKKKITIIFIVAQFQFIRSHRIFRLDNWLTVVL